MPWPAEPVEGGGRPQQLAALRAGKHPKTGDYIRAPCPEPRWDLLATSVGEALAVPRIARGFLAQRQPAHLRQARVDPPPPGGDPARLASALTVALVGDGVRDAVAGDVTNCGPCASTIYTVRPSLPPEGVQLGVDGAAGSGHHAYLPMLPLPLLPSHTSLSLKTHMFTT